jgi:hypothetical protein
VAVRKLKIRPLGGVTCSCSNPIIQKFAESGVRIFLTKKSEFLGFSALISLCYLSKNSAPGREPYLLLKSLIKLLHPSPGLLMGNRGKRALSVLAKDIPATPKTGLWPQA